MRLNSLIATVAACAVFVLNGCGITNGEVEPFTPPDEETNIVQAVIDGVAFTAIGKSTLEVGHSSDSFSFTARDSNGARLFVNLTGVGKPGTYSLSPDGNGAAGYTLGTASWESAIAGGSGTITFSTLTLIRAIGTFSLSAAPVPGTTATGAKVVTTGVFDISFGAQ